MEQQNKIDYIVENVVAINKTLEFQNKQLEEHIKRTSLLEQRLQPIEDHVKFVQGVLRLGAYIGSFIGIFLSILQYLKGVH